MPEGIILAATYFIVAVATYIFVQAASIPYQNRTDRLWKTLEETEEETKP